MNELLPCPFCGASSDRILLQEQEPHTHLIATFMPDHPGSATIECGGCNVGMIEDTADKVIAAWNTRGQRIPASQEMADESPDTQSVQLVISEQHERIEALTWVPVSKRLPDSDLTVLLFNADADEPVWLGYRDDNDGWLYVDAVEAAPTHWAEMPGGPTVSAPPNCGACPGDGSICESTCKVVAESPVAQALDVDSLMTKIQEFASTWAVSGGRFDDGTAMDRAEEAREEIRAILAHKLR